MGNFSDVFKAVFATTKTTATHLPVVTSAGAPDGIISTSDLASVLGVLERGGSLDSRYDLNDKPLGFYTINTSNGVPAGMPNGYSSNGFFMGIRGSSSSAWGVQILLQTSTGTGVRKAFWRAHTSSAFTSWQEFTCTIVS